MRVRALLTNGPTNELLEGREKVVEGTDRQGRERENKEGERRWAADTAADGKIDGTCMNERTAGGRPRTTNRPHEGRPIWG